MQQVPKILGNIFRSIKWDEKRKKLNFIYYVIQFSGSGCHFFVPCLCSLFKSILPCASLQSCIPNHRKLYPAHLEGSSKKCWLRFWWNHEIFMLHIQHLNMLNIKILKDDKCSFFFLHPFHWSLYLSCILNFNWLLLEFCSTLNLNILNLSSWRSKQWDCQNSPKCKNAW